LGVAGGRVNLDLGNWQRPSRALPPVASWTSPPYADAGISPAPGSARTGRRQAARLPADAVVVL